MVLLVISVKQQFVFQSTNLKGSKSIQQFQANLLQIFDLPEFQIIVSVSVVIFVIRFKMRKFTEEECNKEYFLLQQRIELFQQTDAAGGPA